MNLSRLQKDPICGAGLDQPNRDPRTHRYTLSRRRFFRTAGGVVSASVALGALRLPIAEAQTANQPLPIPGGSPAIQQMAGGQVFHVYGPGPAGPNSIDPEDAEPSTITDFKGAVGLAYLNGTVTRTNTVTGETLTLPFVNTDMRFMKGIFRGTDGQIHEGAFAFV